MAESPGVSSGSLLASIIRPRQKERKHYTEDAINDEEIEGKRMFSVEEKLTNDKFCNYFVKEMKGDEFNLRYLQEHGFESPVMIREKTGLGLRVPSKNFTVNDVRQCVGSRRMLDVMDVTTQKDIEMSMKDWVKYYETPVRDKLLNVISLEFSHTKLENYVESPTVVRHIDWVDRVWPRHLKQSQTEATNIIDDMKYPKVQKYCLMSVKGCYTDFHIDFGGTSVWYHILHGSKVFWLIPPTEKNLQLYETWVLSGKQGDVFFGDTVERCGRIHLTEGWTFFIPTGWIHAVYTPQDSLVFGGNFLHSFGIEKQIRVAQTEDFTHVPTKFRYPFYTEMLWYVLERYAHCLTGRTHLYPVDLEDAAENSETTPKHQESKREPREGGLLADRSSGALITPPESPRSPHNAESSGSEMNFIGSPQLAANQQKRKVAASTASSTILSFGKLIDGSAASEVPFFGHAFPVNSSQFTAHPDLLATDARIDATNVEAVRLILDGVSRLHHPSLQQAPPPPFEAPQEAVATPRGLPHNHIHLTRFEINGLKAIIRWLTSLTNSKKNIPDLIKNHINLLADIKLLLELHKSDDAKLAITGKPVLNWPDSPKVPKSPIILKIRPTKPRPGPSSGGKSKGSGSSKGNSSARRRRTRCKKCEACLRTDCGECHFCKDMRKFGGPGRMKQSCISRQCMAPVLPHTACCMVCGKDGWEKVDNTEEEVSSLMECSICWEIVHPDCIRNRGAVTGGGGGGSGEGLMNEDLPNSWECPRCCGDGKGGQSKVIITFFIAFFPRQVKGTRHKPTDALRSPLGGSSLQPIEHASASTTNSAAIDVLETPPTLIPAVVLPEPEVAKRKALDESEQRKKVKPTDVKEPQSSLQENSSAVVNTMPMCILRRPFFKDEKTEDRKKRKEDAPNSFTKLPKAEGEGHVRSCSKGDGTLHPLLRNAIHGANEQVRSPRVLVPHQNSNTDENKHKELMKCEVKVEKCDGDVLQRKRKLNSEATVQQPRDSEGNRRQQRNLSLSRRQTTNGKTQLRKPLYVVRPASSERLPLEAEMTNGNAVSCPAMDRTAMMHVFTYLHHSDLSRCMRVCREWSKWCLESRLWQHIDLTGGKITAAHLAGLVRRQPRSLVLAHTNLSKKLLAWLLCRLPRLHHLDLKGCTSATVTALRTCTTPTLTSLNLNLVEAFNDPLLRELLSPPPDSRPGLIESKSRLFKLSRLSLSGCDITDVSLRYITQHLRLLTELDISYCTKLSDAGISLLVAVGSVIRDSLVSLNLKGCYRLTDASLEHMKRCSQLARVDLRSCPEISVNACRKFILQSKLGLVMNENKLIEQK
uniref:[histone H3]-dimethyl-L-lysine(36) demethylase n=1 Tax=Strigamia maritima TaxID=126957 RepID=T1JN42_STRMM